MSLRVLLADDDEDDIILFREAIEEINKNITLDAVQDGQMLMNYFLSDNFVPDFLFLDLNMPRKNGIECLQEIRRINKFNDVFIVIYSTSSRKKDIVEARILGANLYLTKPSSFDLLIKNIGDILAIEKKLFLPVVNESKFLFSEF